MDQDHCSCGHALPHSHFCMYCYLHSQSSQGVMTWNLLGTFWCTSTWAHSLGRASRLLPKGRSMNGSVRRKCPHPLRLFAKDIHVSASCLFWGPDVLNFIIEHWWIVFHAKIMQLLYSTLGFVVFIFLMQAKLWMSSYCVSSFLLLQPSSPHIWIFAVHYVSMTSQITLIYASSSGIFSTVRVSPMIMSLIGTCWNL